MTATLDIDDIKADTEDEVEQQLRVALRYLETFGWTQGSFGYILRGDMGKCACALGAMNAAADLLDTEAILDDSEHALASVVNGPVINWNDAKGRTVEDVEAAFAAAIKNRQGAIA
ncbi:hypothetical protein NJBCHELONAE_48880 [Mycobacteroides chelonae]|uniref:DUF6197 family protein n=1 Tax=Mycobacteroides chelonae TaxID=1774 RepID=UPI0021DD2DF4|nr:hypothetical protein [Mycobacteroides chelonae]GLE59575.1 hypothetical protein NJBCHELONAE_48880 [Mycobacteroides chelonae]